jgi:polyisoprenoid-binding protein YceI
LKKVQQQGKNMPAGNKLAAAIALASAHALAADNYTVDTDHTYPSLEFSHMGISTWRGKFNKTSGKITLDRAAGTGTADIRVDVTSIDFGHVLMKRFALGEDWLNPDKFPTMTYKGTIVFKGDTPDSVDGQLTLLGVTKPLKLKINSFKCIEHPMFKKEVCGADAEGDMNRVEWGMKEYPEGGKLHLRIQVEANKDDDPLQKSSS